MIPFASIDFESTFFPKKKIGLKTLGVDQYLWHPEVEIYLVSIHTADGSFVGHPAEFDWDQINKMGWVSHNAAFDRRVFRRLAHDYPELKKLRPAYWHCTANMATWFGAPRDLKGACQYFFNADVSKDARKDMENKTVRELHASSAWPKILEYADRDAYWCYRLWEHKKDEWPDIEKKISEMHTMQCLRGLPADRDYLDKKIQRLSRCCYEAKMDLPWANGTSEEAAVLSHIAVAEECRKLGIKPPSSLAEDSESCQSWELEHPEIPWVSSMRRYRKANLLMTKLMKMRDRIRPFDNRIDFSQKYCGAHTKRASGDQGFNVQGFQRDPFVCINLPDGMSFKDVSDDDLVDMRRAIHAESGKLVIADLSQIEPRTLAWMSNDKAKLEMINRGISVYQVHAIQTLGWPEDEDLKKKDPHKYQMCKMRVLGLSYGCGWNRFISYCWNQFGHRMTARESKQQVNDFRRKEKKIKALWNKLDAALADSVGQDLVIELPSWNSQVYKDVHQQKGKFKTEITATLATGRKNRLWGSLLCENIIQATSRDCFYEKQVMLEDAGIPTLFSVHDEVITDEIHDSQAREALEYVQEVLAAECSWMPGVALDSEAVISPYYLK